MGTRAVGRASSGDRLRTLLVGDDGMSTAEYAIGTIAAAAFAAILYAVVSGYASRPSYLDLASPALVISA